MAQFPFAHTIDMTYRLRDGILEVETSIENHAVEPMPVSVAFPSLLQASRFAAKFLEGCPAGNRKLRALASSLVATGETKPMTYKNPQPLEGVSLDDVLGGLIPG